MRMFTTLKTKREAKGISQEKLARIVNVSRETIRKVESGVTVPSVLLAIEIAKAVDEDVEDLFKRMD